MRFIRTDYLQSTCVDFRWVAKRWKTCVYLRPNLGSAKVHASPRKSSQVDASPRKWVAKRNASPKLASTCESVWPGLKCTNSQNHWPRIIRELYLNYEVLSVCFRRLCMMGCGVGGALVHLSHLHTELQWYESRWSVTLADLLIFGVLFLVLSFSCVSGQVLG